MLEMPSAASSTIRARWGKPAATIEDRVSDTRVSRSQLRNGSAAFACTMISDPYCQKFLDTRH